MYLPGDICLKIVGGEVQEVTVWMIPASPQLDLGFLVLYIFIHFMHSECRWMHKRISDTKTQPENLGKPYKELFQSWNSVRFRRRIHQLAR